MKHHMIERSYGDISPLAGAIFMANGATRKECFKLKLFGSPSSQSGFVKRIKAGMILFLFDYDDKKLYGVFEATSDGSMNIMPDAYTSSGMQYPAQIQFKIIWKCSPLKEDEFRDSIIENYFTSNKFNFDLSYEQVMNLILLFSSKRFTSTCHHDQIGKKHIKLQGSYAADMDNMTQQNCLVQFDESDNSRYNSSDSKDQHNTIENDVDFSIFSKSNPEIVEGSELYAPGEYTEDFCASLPHISDFTGYTYRSISKTPGKFPISSPHLCRDHYLPNCLHARFPSVSREINPFLSSTLTDYRKSSIEADSQHFGNFPYLTQHNSRTEFPPSACLDVNESINYKGYRDSSNRIFEYSPTSLTTADSQGRDTVKNNYKSYLELCDHSILQDDVLSPRRLLTRGTNSLTSILGVSDYFPHHQSSLGILTTSSKGSLKPNLGVSCSSVSPRPRETRERSGDLHNWHDYPCPSSFNPMLENKDVTDYLDSSNLRSTFRNSSLLKYGYPSMFEDCKDYKNENVFGGMEASMVIEDSEKNPYLFNSTNKIHNEIHHNRTSQDEQEAYIPYSHHLLDNHHRRSSVFTRLSNDQNSQEIEELAHEPQTNPSVEELVEIMELRRKKWINTSPLKETTNQYSNKLQEFLSLENSVDDQDMNPSIGKLVEIMKPRRKKCSSSSLKKIINEAIGRPRECLLGKPIEQECACSEKLYSVKTLKNMKLHPESIPETVELPYINFRRRTDASKLTGETRQTVHKRRKLVRPSFIQESNLNKGNTECTNVLASSEVAAAGRSVLLAEEVHQSNPVDNPVIERLENTATAEQNHGKTKKLVRSSLTEEVTSCNQDNKNSNLLDCEEVGDGSGHEFQRPLLFRIVSQSHKSNVINEGYNPLCEEYNLDEGNCKNCKMSGSSEEDSGTGSLKTDLDVQRSIQNFPLTENTTSAEALPGIMRRRKLARPSISEKETMTTGDNVYANMLVCPHRENPVDALVINSPEKTDTWGGIHKRRKLVIPCLNEEDKHSTGHSKCSNVFGSSEVVAKSEVPGLILLGNSLIEGPENTENENTSHQVGLENTGSGQFENIETTVIDESVSSGLGISISVMGGNVIEMVELEEKQSNLVDRNGTETNSFSDGSSTHLNIDISTTEKPSEVSKEYEDCMIS